MTAYFAYGSNMSRALMGMRCPSARAVGPAVLDDHRFVITADGYASVIAQPGEMVHGILWRLTPRDIAVLNAFEGIDSGLYRCRVLPVRAQGRRVAALVYVARARARGRPRPGYLEAVVAAAREWGLPADYARSLERWAPSGLRSAPAPETGEIAWARR